MTVFEAIQNRRSVRAYDSKPIPSALLDRMCEALRLAPSACNKQPWKFVIVSDPKIKTELVAAAGKQAFIAEAPVVIVGVGFPDQAFKWMGDVGNSVDVDLAIALDHLTLAAAEAGLGTCWIGAFQETEVKKILRVPEEAKVVALTPLGYPKDPKAFHTKTSRKPASEVFVKDRF